MYLTLNKTETKFLVEFPYNQVYSDRIYTIPGSRWNKIERGWEIPKDIFTLRQFRVLFPWSQVDGRVNIWENAFKAHEIINLAMKKDADSYYTKQDWDNFYFKLRPYQHQIKALDLVYQNKNYALAMEMGTGKTACIINLIRKLKAEGTNLPSLVVCPLSVVSVWEDEIKKHSDQLKCVKLVGSKYERTKKLNEEADIFIINYEGMRILEDELKYFAWLMVVADESQKIKNRTTRQSKVCYKLGRNANRRYILTGTMITNNPLDAFGQFKFLNEEILGSNYYGFQSRYAIMVTNGRAKFPVRFINLEELANRIEPWAYRVTKKECLDLPDKVYETRYISLSDKARHVYKTLSQELMAFLESGDRVTAQIVLTKLLRFSQITAGFVTTETGQTEEVGNEEKIRELEDIIEQSEGQVVVWTKFVHEMAMVARRLDRLGTRYACLDGSTPQERREEILRDFRDGKLKVFVGQIVAGGLGINLNTASTCVYMSNSYSLGDRLQSEDRLHRLGQKNNVTYIDLICPGTIDEKVLGMLRKKKNIADLINKDTDRKEFVKGLIGEKTMKEVTDESRSD